MKNEKGTVSVALVQETLRLARKNGLNIEALIDRAGFPPAILASPKSRVSSDQYGKLWNAIARESDDEFFGQDSHPMRCGSFIAMTRSALTSSTGERALASAVSFMHLVLDDFLVDVEYGKDYVRLRFSRVEARVESKMFVFATYFLLVYGLVCWLIGHRISVRQACFSCPEPPAVEEYRLLFCDKLSFNCEYSFVDLSNDFLSLPVVQNSKTVKKFLQDAPGNFVVKYRNRDSFSAHIRRSLRERKVADWPSSAELARSLHITEVTMRRRLRNEGFTYLAIKDQLRRDIAVSELQDTNRSVGSIAESLGFAEPSAFYRAFQKWTGLRPGDYRSAKKRES